MVWGLGGFSFLMLQTFSFWFNNYNYYLTFCLPNLSFIFPRWTYWGMGSHIKSKQINKQNRWNITAKIALRIVISISSFICYCFLTIFFTQNLINCFKRANKEISFEYSSACFTVTESALTLLNLSNTPNKNIWKWKSKKTTTPLEVNLKFQSNFNSTRF